MSNQSRGPGWWQASDGKWYPPESARSTLPPPPPPPVEHVSGPAQSPGELRAVDRVAFAKRLLRLSWIFWAVGFVPYMVLVIAGGNCGRSGGCERESMNLPVAIGSWVYFALPIAGQLAAAIIAGHAYSDLPPDLTQRRAAQLVIALSLLVPGMGLFGWLIEGQSR